MPVWVGVTASDDGDSPRSGVGFLILKQTSESMGAKGVSTSLGSVSLCWCRCWNGKRRNIWKGCCLLTGLMLFGFSHARMELRCVIAVIRHGDRTPKQKMKMEVKHSR